MADAITITCAAALKGSWPKPLAEDWLKKYPAIFDENDLELAVSQPRNHFCEWYTAIHLFQKEHALALVEKYDIQKHGRKYHLFVKHLSVSQRNTLFKIRQEFGVQLPDLFVIGASGDCWFVEVKGPGDRISEMQRRSHEAITSKLGIPVRIINVSIEDSVIEEGEISQDAAIALSCSGDDRHVLYSSSPFVIALKRRLDIWANSRHVACRLEGRSFKYRVGDTIVSLIVTEHKLDINLEKVRARGNHSLAREVVEAVQRIRPKATQTRPGLDCPLAVKHWSSLEVILDRLIQKPTYSD
jgi:hypothetical protein